MVWRAAVKLAYDGRDFMGSQRQPEERTVEGETIRALNRIGAVDSVIGSHFRTASRTDRGVSALGNVMAFNTDFRRDQLLRALNAASEGIYFYGLAEVDPDFSPRRAQGRWYRYLLPAEGLEVDGVRECAQVFQGKHDFRRFCKPEGRSSIKCLDQVEVSVSGEFLVIDLRGREFLRNMVRRIVAALSEVGGRKASLQQVRAAIEGEDISFGLASPENLTLMDVWYGFEFDVDCPTTLDRKVDHYRLDTLGRMAFIDALQCRCRLPSG